MDQDRIRKPVVAGQFYPASAKGLREEIQGFIDKELRKSDCLACMVPHAGYMYSGMVAAQTISSVNLKDKIILLGPNHTGLGEPFSIMTEGVWQTPLGDVKIEAHLARKILEGSKFLESDSVAHAQEHSLEVELPILQYFKPDFEIVPIAFLSDNLTALKEVGREIAVAIESLGLKDSILILASSDMTHYESQKDAEEKDKEAIRAILELDPDRLMERISRLNISMCGYAPVIVMLSAAKLMGARQAQLVKYQTSGDITEDYSSVVGYAGITVY